MASNFYISRQTEILQKGLRIVNKRNETLIEIVCTQDDIPGFSWNVFSLLPTYR